MGYSRGPRKPSGSLPPDHRDTALGGLGSGAFEFRAALKGSANRVMPPRPAGCCATSAACSTSLDLSRLRGEALQHCLPGQTAKALSPGQGAGEGELCVPPFLHLHLSPPIKSVGPRVVQLWVPTQTSCFGA